MYPSGIAPVPLARDFIAGPAAFGLPLIGGIAFGIAIVCLIGQPPWGDQSMYLMAAGKALDGARFGRDIVDVNPPLVVWFSVVAVAIARWLGVLPQTAMQAVLGVLTLGMVVWCRALIKRPSCAFLSSPSTWWLAALLLYATTIHPWYHVGSREHILLLLLLPYLFLAGRRLDGRPDAPFGARLLVGLAAVAGCGMKPQHLLVVVAIEALLLVHERSWRSLARPEIAAIIGGGLVYCLSVAILTPEYLTVVVPFARDAYLDRDLASWGEIFMPIRMAKIGVAILLWLYLRRLSEQRALGDVFMIAGLMGTIVYVLQRKGFEYQLVPALAFFHLGVGVTIIGVIAPRLRHRFHAISGRARAATALIAALVVGVAYYPVQLHRAATQWSDVRKEARKAITPHIPRGTTVFMVSPVVGPLHDYLLRHGLEWGSRFTVMFMTEALVTHDLSAPRNAALARWTLNSVVEDLGHYRPGVILVDRCQDTAFPPCQAFGDGRTDLLAWFQQDPAFKSAWTRYEKRRQVGPYEIWCAIDDERACPPLLAAVPRG